MKTSYVMQLKIRPGNFLKCQTSHWFILQLTESGLEDQDVIDGSQLFKILFIGNYLLARWRPSTNFKCP